MSHPALERRIAEREEMIETARRYARQLGSRLHLERAWVTGSVARGDFNVWSDIDLVIVVPHLPRRLLDRLALFSDRPPKVEVAAFTRGELEDQEKRGNPLVLEALSAGVGVYPSSVEEGDLEPVS